MADIRGSFFWLESSTMALAFFDSCLLWDTKFSNWTSQNIYGFTLNPLIDWGRTSEGYFESKDLMPLEKCKFVISVWREKWKMGENLPEL